MSAFNADLDRDNGDMDNDDRDIAVGGPTRPHTRWHYHMAQPIGTSCMCRWALVRVILRFSRGYEPQ